MADDDSFGDELVAEIDVNLSQPPVGSELYVLQYPNHTPNAGIGKSRAIEGIRIRPAFRRLEMSVSIYPRPPDASSALSEKSFDFSDYHMAERPVSDSQTLYSAQPRHPEVNTLIGAFAPAQTAADGQGAMTFVPIQRTTQMRCSFEYLDKLDAERQHAKAMMKAAKEKDKGTLDASVNEDQPEDGELQVEMTFMKRESDRAAERRKTSLSHFRSLEEEDKWKDLSFYAEDTLESKDRMESLFDMRPTAAPLSQIADGAEASSLANGANAQRSYIEWFYQHAPRADPMQNTARQMGDAIAGHGSMRALRRMRPEGSIQLLLTHARLASIVEVRDCIAGSTSNEDLLHALQQVGWLLRSGWVCNSPRRTSSRFASQKQVPRLLASRVLTLSMFLNATEVTIKELLEREFATATPPPREVLESFLSEVAERRPGQGWVFRLDDAVASNGAPPSVQVQQRADWDERIRNARNVIASGGAPPRRGGSNRRPKQ